VPRLAVALSAAALVVALLGTTPLGSAAEQTVKKVVKAGKSEQSSGRGPRGRRGPRGPRGPRGFQGPPGEKGDSGLPDGFTVRSRSVTVTGTSRETATQIATLAELPPNQYLINAQVTATGTGTSRVVCEGSAGTNTGQGKTQIGSGLGASRVASIGIVFGTALPNGGSAQLKCWLEERIAPDPIVTADMAAAPIDVWRYTPPQ
jgi:hypothetical protein